ncbi:hypothetical protein PU560_13530, partial [Georgenia sp. 10Sc9-8]|nr:hypothetical protein [Georgenia halotolerans]
MSEPLQSRLLKELLLLLDPVRVALADPDPVDALLQLMADAFVDGEALFGRTRVEQWQTALDAAWQTVAGLDDADFDPARLPATAAAVADVVDVVTELTQDPVAPEADVTAEEAGRRLLDHLMGRYLAEHRTTMHSTLTMLRVLSPPDTEVGRSAVLHLDRIGQWVSDAADLSQALIGWGTPDFDPDLHVRALGRAMEQLGLAAWVEEERPLALEPGLSFPEPVPHTAAAYLLLLALDDPAVLRFGLRVQASPPSQAGDDAGFALSPFGNVAARAEQHLDDAGTWAVEVTLDGDLSDQLFVSLRPGAAGVVDGDGAAWTLTTRLHRSAGAEPLQAVDMPGLTVGLGRPALTLTVRGEGGALDLAVSVGTEDAELTLGAPEGDGFLARLLP